MKEFLYTNPLSKRTRRVFSKRKELASNGSEFFPFVIDTLSFLSVDPFHFYGRPFLRRKGNNFDTAVAIGSVSNPLLTLKGPKKTASENVVCLCRLLIFLQNFQTYFAYRQTVWTQIRLLIKEQSDLGPHCLQK